MVNEMDSNSNHSSLSNNAEDVQMRRATTPTSASHHLQSANVSSARQSPKITSFVASPSALHVSSVLNVATLTRNSSSPATIIPRKVMSRNHNNTSFPTTFPSNLAELQLFRVMQNASLLYYYDTLLEMGGDDVQQLCDAGEEEFLEIMSLVGMASKPLHVRRFQKSLQEWVTNPTKFKTPLSPGDDFELDQPHRTTPQFTFEEAARTLYAASPASPNTPNTNQKRPYSPLDATGSCPPSSSSSPGSCTSLNNLMTTTPTLQESHVTKLATAAERLSKQLPQLEPKPQNQKKKMCKELESVMSMPEGDPRRMDEIRRYAAIYGRFDCKRKPEKPLTLHEVSVNEAAAQICRFVPALLTRRDELFPLARQVVKDSGCHYSKTGVGYSSMCLRTGPSDLIDNLSNSNSNPSNMRTMRLADDLGKRPRFEEHYDEDTLPNAKRQQEFLRQYDSNARSSIHFSASLLHSKSHTASRICSLGTDEETEIHYSLSNSNSPLHEPEKLENNVDTEDEKLDQIDSTDVKYSPRVQVIASSGNNIIAVANPALALSPAILPMEHMTD